jgi:exopolysaccharide biosynthesis predicted pyruvyltransferase EpsI
MKTAILINDTSGEHHIGCDTVIANIKSLCKERDIEITQTFTRQDVRIDSPKLKDAITTSDIVIINGEGSLHDQYGRNFLTSLLKMLSNKKAVLINSVWYNMGHVPEMSKLAIISFRETRSKVEFDKDHLNFIKISEVVPDVIFATELPPENIGTGDSVYGHITNILSKVKNYFPLDYHRPSSPQFPKEIKTYSQKDINDYIKWLKTLDLYITGRFHGVCLAILTGTPFLAMPSNAKKIEALIRDATTQDLIITSLDEIENKKNNAYASVGQMKEYSEEAKEKIKNLFDRIKNLLD